MGGTNHHRDSLFQWSLWHHHAGRRHTNDTDQQQIPQEVLPVTKSREQWVAGAVAIDRAYSDTHNKTQDRSYHKTFHAKVYRDKQRRRSSSPKTTSLMVTLQIGQG